MHRRFIESFVVALTMAIVAGLCSGRSFIALAQQHTGTDFWLAFPGNSAGADQIQLYIVGTSLTSGTITFAAGSSCNTTFSLTSPAFAQTIALSTSGACAAEIRTADTVEHQGIHVVVTSANARPVTVYGFSSAATPSADRSTDGFLALPVDALGTTYFTVSHPGQDPSSASQFVIVATEDGTTVSITPKTPMAGGHAAGATFSPATMNTGDTYLGLTAAGGDLTGTLITSDKPIAVFSGDRCSNIPIDKPSCGMTVEQLPPTQAWGRTFATTPLLTAGSATSPFTPYATRANGDHFRIVAAGNNTIVTVNGTVAPAPLAAGQALDVVNVTSNQFISADKPILVAQFEQSEGNDSPSFGFNDPSMMLVAPEEQWLAEYYVTTPSSSSPAFDVNFINLVAPEAAIVTVDGTALAIAAWTHLPVSGTPGFKSTRLKVDAGTHTLTGDMAFGVSMYGTAPATSYAYPGGMGAANLCDNSCTPIAVNDFAITSIGMEVEIDALANDFDPNQNPVAPLKILNDFPNLYPADAGTLSNGPNGDVIIFTPAPGFSGQVYFDYKITDNGTGGEARASVSVGVGVAASPIINRPPTAIADAISVPENTSVSGNVGADNGGGADYDVDGDPLTFQLVGSGPQHGVLAGGLASDGSFTYTPQNDFHGVDTFQYQALDPGRPPTSTSLFSDVVTVTISVSGNQAPTATDNDYFMPPKCPAEQYLCSNTVLTGNAVKDDAGHGVDSDPENDTLTASLVTPPTVGTLNFSADGAFTYQPQAGFTGSVTFTYKVNDALTALPPGVHFLTASDVPTLTSWLGGVPVRFDLLFSKRGGDGKTAADYHAAIDDVPRTLTVIRAKDDLDPNPDAPRQIFGGYHPGVFDGGYESVESPTDADRTAFLFNLTDSPARLLSQRLLDQPCVGDDLVPVDCGFTQIWNLGPDTGPAWGDAWDLTIGCKLDGTCDLSDLEVGSAASFTYGAEGTGMFSEGADDRTSVFASPAAAGVLEWGCVHDTACGQFSMTAPDAGFEVYAVRPLFESGGADSAPATVTINVVSDSMTLTGGTFSYDGQTHPAICALTASDGAILPYTLTYNTPGGGAPIAAGSYTATCSFPGDDVGHPAATQTASVTIDKAPVAYEITGVGPHTFDTDINGLITITYAFDGADHGIACIARSPSGASLLPIAIGYNPGTPHNVGSYSATCAFNGDDNHAAGSRTATVVVGKRAITVTANTGQTKVYGGPDPGFTYQVTSGSLLGTDGFSGAPSRDPGENVGSYAIRPGTLTAGDNYVLTFVSNDFAITPKSITVTAHSKTKVYGDAEPALTYEVPTGSMIVGDGFTGGLVRVPGENVGSYAIQQGTLSAGGNYNLTFVERLLSITPRPITVTADPKAKVFGTVDPPLTYQVTSGSLLVTDAFSGTLTRTPGETVGTHAILQGTLTAGANYALTYVGANLTITTGSVTIDVTGDSFTYDGQNHEIQCIVTGADGSLLPYAIGYSPGTPHNVGVYSATCQFNGDANNAPASLTVQVTIDPRSLTVTADAKTKVYGGADPAFTYQLTSGALVNGDGFTGALSRAAGEDVGPHPIQLGTLTAGSNYAITVVEDNLTITPAPIRVMADAQTKVYGAADPALTYQLTSGTLFFGNGFSGKLTRAPGANVGTYPIQQGGLTAGTNYDLSFVGADLTITRAALTVNADDKSRLEGQPNPAFTATITGFQNGDTVAVVAGAPSLSTTATAASPVGTYPILVSQGMLAASNYMFATFVNGTLTVLTPNNAPVANPDAASTFESKAVTINVLANDTDVDGDGLTVSSVATPAHGTATVDPSGVITYTPAANFFGTETFTYTVSDGKGGSAVGTVTVTVSRLGRFVVLSRDVTWLKSNAVVLSGDVGANERRVRSSQGHGSEFDDGDQDDVTVRIGTNVKVQEVGSRVVGDTVILRNNATIYNLVDNFTIDPGTPATILGTVTHPMAIPYVTMPAFPSFTAGTTNIEVAKKATMTLTAGAYGTVRVRGGATLILTGGTYQMQSLDVDQSATVIFQAATEVRIKGELDTDNKAKMVTVSGLTASQVVFYVDGTNDSCGHSGRDVEDGDNGGKATVHIGDNNVIQANIYAPNGTIWIKSKTTATGAYIGQAVRVGQKTTLTLDSAFKF